MEFMETMLIGGPVLWFALTNGPYQELRDDNHTRPERGVDL
jgi:hypothetical protein